MTHAFRPTLQCPSPIAKSSAFIHFPAEGKRERTSFWVRFVVVPSARSCSSSDVLPIP
jgi:hypothetical protein